MDTLGWPFFFGLVAGACAGVALTACFFAYLPPPAKTWIARGERSVLAIRRASTPRERVFFYRQQAEILDLPVEKIQAIADIVVLTPRDKRA